MYTEKDLNVQLTCSACPEQYDVYYLKWEWNRVLIAYIRLRHWYLKVDYYGKEEETIYEHTFDEAFKGIFYTEEERQFYLNIIKNKILEKLNVN